MGKRNRWQQIWAWMGDKGSIYSLPLGVQTAAATSSPPPHSVWDPRAWIGTANIQDGDLDLEVIH